jgi:hypothetical protein
MTRRPQGRPRAFEAAATFNPTAQVEITNLCAAPGAREGPLQQKAAGGLTSPADFPPIPCRGSGRYRRSPWRKPRSLNMRCLSSSAHSRTRESTTPPRISASCSGESGNCRFTAAIWAIPLPGMAGRRLGVHVLNRGDLATISADVTDETAAAPLLELLISFQSADQADQFPMCSRVWVLQLIEAMRIRQAAEIDERANPLPPRLIQIR